jgi:hypothetical protein
MMKKFAFIILLFMLVAPNLPLALAESEPYIPPSTDVDITVVAETVDLTFTSNTTSGGTMSIWVNGVEVKKNIIYQHNYDNDIIYLTQNINGVQLNLIAFANYADGKLSLLLANDATLAKWIGCLDITTETGKRIFEGNTTVVMELNKLSETDIKNTLLLRKEYVALIDILDSKHTKTEADIRRELEDVRLTLSQVDTSLEFHINQLELNAIETNKKLDYLQTQCYVLALGVGLLCVMLLLCLTSERIIKRKIVGDIKVESVPVKSIKIISPSKKTVKILQGNFGLVSKKDLVIFAPFRSTPKIMPNW